MKKLLFYILLGHAGISFCAASSSGPAESNYAREVTKLLKERCAIATAVSTGPAITEDLPLLRAAAQGDDEQVTALLLRNCNPHIADSVYGTTAIMHAAARGHIAVIKTLLSMTSNRRMLMTTQSKDGRCALDFAKSLNQSKAVEILTHLQHKMEFGPFCKTYFSPNILSAISQLIQQEQKHICGAMYSFTHGTPAKLLVEKQKAGIPTLLVVNKDYKSDLCIALKHMISNGIQIYSPQVGSAGHDNPRCFNMHHKFLIFSCNALGKPVLMTGSCNFTDQAFNRNWENIIITDNRESISSYFNEWCRLIRNCAKLSVADCISPKDSQYDARIRNCVQDLQ